MEEFANSDPVGVVEGDAGRPLRLDEWVAWIAADRRLQVPSPIHSVNPFKKTPLIIDLHPGTAYVMADNSRIGMMAWSEDGADEIVVYGSSPIVLAVAKDIAKQLDARFRVLS